MDAKLKQPPRTELLLAPPAPVGSRAASRRLGWLVGAMGFCCLMPYVAIPVGNRSAIQIGDIITIVLVLPVVVLSWKNHPFWIYPALIAPMCISAFKVSLVGDDPALSLKVVVVWSFSLL